MEKTLKELVSAFMISSAEERACIENNAAPKSFDDIARCMLAGHFLVTDGNTEVKVRPTTLEFYYHEEKEGGIKDTIVYHRDTKSSEKPLIPTGFLHNHVSGIDLTFEHENGGKVRASVLIREFIIETDGEEQKKSMKAFNIKVNEKDGRSTGMYAALFSQFSVLDEGFTVRWVDGTVPADVDWMQPRKNVKQYIDGVKQPEKDCLRQWKACLKTDK